MANLQSIWTYSLVNDVITITSNFNFTRISFILVSGTGTYQGGLTANGLPSQPCTLQVGQSVEIDLSTSSILDTIILDSTAGGEIQIIARG